MSARSVSLAHVHGASVHVGKVRVGSVTEVFADPPATRVIGLEVESRDGRRWFLPWAACVLEAGTVRSSSPLVFLPAAQLEFYERAAVPLPSSEVASIAADGRILDRADGSEQRVLARSRAGISAS